MTMAAESMMKQIKRSGVVLGVVAPLLLGTAMPALGGDWGEIGKIVANDRAKGSHFGFDVALSADYIVIGANRDSTGGDSTGSVYVFDMTTGVQLHEIFSPDPTFEGNFGIDVEVDGDLVIVGATDHNDNGSESGAAYIFSASSGALLHKLLPTSGRAGDNFGNSVDIDETTGLAVVAARLRDSGFGTYSGEVFVFDTATGVQLFDMEAIGGAAGDEFGFSVSMQGTTAIIGARGYDESRGAAYIYDLTDGSYVRKIKPPGGGDPVDRFGTEVAISGDIAIIGAEQDDDGGLNAGAAYLYDYITGTLLHKLVGPGTPESELFGFSVDIDGNYAVVGTFPFGEAAHAFIYDVTTGALEQQIEASDGGSFDWYAWNVDILGSRAIIGSHSADGGSLLFKGKGAAYLYELGGGSDMTLSVSDPLIAGQDGTFIVVDGNPNTATYLAYSTAGLGSTFVPQLGITLDINNPAQAGNAKNSDGGGTVFWSLPIPGGASGVHVWFQAAQMGIKSNNVEDRVIQ